MRKITLVLLAAFFALPAAGQSAVKTLKVNRAITKQAKQCIECHAGKSPGIVADWKQSRHAHAGVSCVDCHEVAMHEKLAAQNCPGVKGTETHLTVLVTSKVCGRCHAEERQQFNQSGHYRARKQYINNKDMHELISVHEGRNMPQYKTTSDETGCMQCHGSVISLDKNKRPDKTCWPTAGMGTVYPDGTVGNCVVCHTRHLFSIAEARKPEACASCHLGPDHPNIEIYENSKHGHLYKTQGHEWNYTSAPDAWEPGDYRGPTCATCHQSGIGDLTTTHNVSERLKWNLWAKESKVRNSKDPMSPLAGNGESGRKFMQSVCRNCHSNHHSENYFKQFDDMVGLYNQGYWQPARKMYDELEKKNLLKSNPWEDEFQKIFYHLWHHEGRRMRQGAAMGAPDYAHWHGIFECQQDLYELQIIYKKRIETGKISD
ncbi:MAG: multiheme c-type cytochrome [bacterium]